MGVDDFFDDEFLDFDSDDDFEEFDNSTVLSLVLIILEIV